MFTTENNGLVFWSSSFSSGSVVLKKQQQLQQQQQSNHHNSSFHPKINNNSRNSCMTAKLDSSVTPTKFSATTENSSAISSVVTSPTSSVRSKRMHQTKQGAGTAVMQQQDRGSASEASEPKGPSSTMAAAAAATTMARNNGHRVASAATTNTSTESLDPLNSKLLLSPYIYESIITYSAYPFDLAQKLLQTGDDALHFCHQRFWMSRSSIFKVIIITAATEIKAVQRKLFLVWHKRVLMTSNSREEEPDVINWKAK